MLSEFQMTVSYRNHSGKCIGESLESCISVAVWIFMGLMEMNCIVVVYMKEEGYILNM